MTTAKVFRSGNSQAVRLPLEVRFADSVTEVSARREGERLILEPVCAERFDDAFWSVLGSLPEFRRPAQRRQRRKPIFP